MKHVNSHTEFGLSVDFPEWESFPDARTLKNRTQTRF